LDEALFTRAEINEKRREINKIIVPAGLDKIKTLEDVFKRDITLDTWRQIPSKLVDIVFDGQGSSYGHYLKKRLELNAANSPDQSVVVDRIKNIVFENCTPDPSKKAGLNNNSTLHEILQCVPEDKKK